MDYSILQNADVLLIGATLIPIIVQFLKKRVPQVRPQLLSFLVSFAFALVVLLISIGISGATLSEIAPQSLAIALVAWRWADGTYKTVKVDTKAKK